MIQCTVCMQGTQREINTKALGFGLMASVHIQCASLVACWRNMLCGKGRLGMCFLGDPMR